MVLAHHLIFGAYGFWLPNDPRGSWSDWVGAWDLFRYGPATKADTRRSVAHASHNRQVRLEAKQSLKLPAVAFTGMQARAIGRAFANYCEKSGLIVRACAILPDHVHLVVNRFRLNAEQIVNQLKGDATQQLVTEGIHPFLQFKAANHRVPKCWARGLWKVFIDDDLDLERAVRYVENNPLKEGKPRQKWTFVRSV